MRRPSIENAIQSNPHFVFKPNLGFYKAVGINSKRWGLLIRGQLELKQSEIQALANYFNVPVTNFFKQENPAATTNC